MTSETNKKNLPNGKKAYPVNNYADIMLTEKRRVNIDGLSPTLKEQSEKINCLTVHSNPIATILIFEKMGAAYCKAKFQRPRTQ